MQDRTDSEPRDPLLRRVGMALGGATGLVVRSLGWPFSGRRRSAAKKSDDAPPAPARASRSRDRDKSRPPDPARLGSAEGLEALTRALADPDPAVRSLALEVVTEFSGERASRLLGGMLQDPDPNVRCAAAAAATRVGSSATVFSLILALEDSEPTVREAAASAIETIGGRRIDRAALADPATAGPQLDDLKAWWKDRRLAELSRAADL